MATTLSPDTATQNSSFELSPGTIQMIGVSVGFCILLLVAFFLFSNLKRLSHLPIGRRDWTDKIRTFADDERDQRINALMLHIRANKSRRQDAQQDLTTVSPPGSVPPPPSYYVSPTGQ
ncbi:uncharacterized protein [Ptychodera flava]|uniref:uncharacterized protein n=1 Tax=Ptychodera flava TaxID=63121 RepID=UPI00396A8B90